MLNNDLSKLMCRSEHNDWHTTWACLPMFGGVFKTQGQTFS